MFGTVKNSGVQRETQAEGVYADDALVFIHKITLKLSTIIQNQATGVLFTSTYLLISIFNTMAVFDMPALTLLTLNRFTKKLQVSRWKLRAKMYLSNLISTNYKHKCNSLPLVKLLTVQTQARNITSKQ